MKHLGTRIRKRTSGLTLVETMVVIFVFSLLTTVAVQLLLAGVRAWRQGQVRGSLRSHGRRALDDFATDFRQAVSVSLPLAQTTTPVTQVQFTRPTVGTPTSTSTVTWTINDSTGSPANCLVRTEGTTTAVEATNLVVTDAVTSTKLCYFQWVDQQNKVGTNTGATAIQLNLYMSQVAGVGQKADIASYLTTATATPASYIQPVNDVTLQTVAFYHSAVNQYPQGAATANPLITTVANAASLGDPRSHSFARHLKTSSAP